MNLSPAGKQPLMQDTVFRGQDGQLYPQSMAFRRGDTLWDSNIPILEECVNKPKGMKSVLQERGLWRPDLLKQCGRAKDRKSRNLGYGDRLFEEEMGDYEARTADRCEIGKACCHLRILEAQPDFLEEKSMLETVVNAAGHEVIFYPKFHCELNYIEYYWGAVNRYTRANCQYSFPELEKILFVALDSVALKTIR